jgi:branched-subunit amino acid transport protein
VTAWSIVAALCVGTAVIKASGPLAVGAKPPSERVERVIALVAPALLTGLVVYETFRSGTHGLTIDARAAGLVAAAAALAARLPLTVVIFGAAAVAAGVRAIS